MNLSFFIARRLYFNEHSDRHISKLAINIATVGVTIGLAVMIVSVCVLLGFKRELTDKIVGFGSHIQILNANVGSSPESFPIVTDSAFVDRVKGVAHVEHVQRFSHKMGIIKTDDDFKGILLKGIGEDYDTRFLGKHLLEGSLPDYRGEAHRNDVLVSRATADQMHLKAGDKVYAYFFEDNVRTRLFRVAGIYQTNMSQFDDNIIIADIRTVNKLNNWRADQSSGLEVFTDDFPNTINTYIDLISKVTRDAADADGNVIRGRVLPLSSADNILINDDEKTLIGVIGIRDAAIIKSGDGILVCALSEEQRVRDLVRRIDDSDFV